MHRRPLTWHWLGNWCEKLPATDGSSEAPTLTLFGHFQFTFVLTKPKLDMDGIQGQSGVGESQNKAVCLNLLHDTAIDVLLFFCLQHWL